MYFCNMQENGVSEPLIRGHYKEIEKHAKHLRGAIAPQTKPAFSVPTNLN